MEGAGEGIPDTDIVLTTRELGRLIKLCRIDFTALPDEQFDPAMGESTGAAVIFGSTGGVMEAALRTAADVLEGRSVENIEYHEVRGGAGIKEAVYKIAGVDVKVAVVSGLNNANEVLTKVKNGEADYHFIEIMCCPGGCVNGAGQPIVEDDAKAKRGPGLYSADLQTSIRTSDANPLMEKLYATCLKDLSLIHI